MGQDTVHKPAAQMRAEYLRQAGPRYRRAGRALKKCILDEFCAVCGYERKYGIKLLKGRRKPKASPARRGAPPRYGQAHLAPLKAIWLASQQPCSKRLKALLATWLPFYERRHGELADTVRRELLAISPATIDRLLKPVRLEGPARRRPSPPGSLLRTQIPVRTRWEEARDSAGWIEADTVAHCGGSMAGEFVWSLTLTDIHSGWTELGAVWNRGGEGVVAAIERIERRLVFPILGFDSDNGSEFLNHHLVRHFAGDKRRLPVIQTRARPYISNDQAHVEQKQWTHVRQVLGYERIDDPALIELIERLYLPWSRLHNFFLPSVKLKHKWRDGARVGRRHDDPATPCDRLLACPTLDNKAKVRLIHMRHKLDPFELERQVEAALRPIQRWLSQRRALVPGALPPDPRSFPLSGPSEPTVKKHGPELTGSRANL
jgi:hypothetical protein